MNKAEVAELLAIASVVDNRTVATETVNVWHAAIGHIDYDVAVEALNLFRQESTDYLVPAHIVQFGHRVNPRDGWGHLRVLGGQR